MRPKVEADVARDDMARNPEAGNEVGLYTRDLRITELDIGHRGTRPLCDLAKLDITCRTSLAIFENVSEGPLPLDLGTYPETIQWGATFSRLCDLAIR